MSYETILLAILQFIQYTTVLQFYLSIDHHWIEDTHNIIVCALEVGIFMNIFHIAYSAMAQTKEEEKTHRTKTSM